MTNRAKLRRMPIVITQLRLRAGFKSVNATATEIQKKTGTRLHRAQISHWEHGKAMPSLASLLTFLEGLGFSLQDFQDELDRASGEDVPARASAPASAAPDPLPPAENDLARRIEALEQRLRALDDAGSGD